MFVKAQWTWGPVKFSVGVDPLNMLPGLMLPGVGNFSLYIGHVIKFSGKDFVLDCADLVVRRIFKECVKHFFAHREKKDEKHTWSNVFEVFKFAVLATAIVAGLHLFSQAALYTTGATIFMATLATMVFVYNHFPQSAKTVD